MAKRSKTTAVPTDTTLVDTPLVVTPLVDKPVATPLVLPPELTIYSVGELHPQWLAWLGQGGAAVPAEVQGTAVDQVDAAGLQLLLSLQRALAQQGRTLQIQAPSPVLRGGCEALGLSQWLQTQTSHLADEVTA